MKFQVSICDPLKPDVIELGEHNANEILPMFHKIDWNDVLQNGDQGGDTPYYSPSFGIESADGYGVTGSIIEPNKEIGWYIFLNIPEGEKNAGLHDILDTSEAQLIEAFELLLSDDIAGLKTLFKIKEIKAPERTASKSVLGQLLKGLLNLFK